MIMMQNTLDNRLTAWLTECLDRPEYNRLTLTVDAARQAVQRLMYLGVINHRQSHQICMEIQASVIPNELWPKRLDDE